jgi:hypothetical protein
LNRLRISQGKHSTGQAKTRNIETTKTFFFDRIYTIARIEQERMNDRSEAPRTQVLGEALMTPIKALEKLHGLGKS